MSSKYLFQVAKVALRDPRKIPSMARLKWSKRNDWAFDFDSPSPQKISPPQVIAIRLNYACNLRCVMCNQWGEKGVFITTPERLVRREMTKEDFFRFIDDVAGFSPYLYFTGGEPLMNKDILDVVSYASKKHLVTSMSTNSTYLKEKAEGLIKAGLDYLYTSLDAPAPSREDIIRVQASGGDSNFDAVEAIKFVRSLRDKIGGGLPVMQTQTIIVKENQDQLLDMAHFVEKEIKPDVWGLQLCVFTTPELNEATTKTYREKFSQDQVGWAGFIRDFTGIDCEKIQRQLDQIAARKWNFKLRMYKPLGMKGFNLAEYFLKPEIYSTEEPLTCMNPYVFAQLQPNGDIAFCGSQPDYVIGNVKKTPFHELWNGERAAKWRSFLQKQLFSSCSRCFSLHEFSHFRGEAKDSSRVRFMRKK